METNHNGSCSYQDNKSEESPCISNMKDQCKESTGEPFQSVQKAQEELDERHPSQHIHEPNYGDGQEQYQQWNETYYNQNTAHPWQLNIPPPMYDWYPAYHQQAPFVPVHVPVPVPVSVIHHFACANSSYYNDLSSPDRTPRRVKKSKKPKECDADVSSALDLPHVQRTSRCQSEASSITHDTDSSPAVSPRRRRRRGRKKRHQTPPVAINENRSFHQSGEDGRAKVENLVSSLDKEEILDYDLEETETSTPGTSISDYVIINF